MSSDKGADTRHRGENALPDEEYELLPCNEEKTLVTLRRSWHACYLDQLPRRSSDLPSVQVAAQIAEKNKSTMPPLVAATVRREFGVIPVSIYGLGSYFWGQSGYRDIDLMVFVDSSMEPHFQALPLCSSNPEIMVDLQIIGLDYFDDQRIGCSVNNRFKPSFWLRPRPVLWTNIAGCFGSGALLVGPDVLHEFVPSRLELFALAEVLSHYRPQWFSEEKIARRTREAELLGLILRGNVEWEPRSSQMGSRRSADADPDAVADGGAR